MSKVQSELEHLRSLGLNDFDPAFFHFIENLVERASSLPGSARLKLEERAEYYLEEFHRKRSHCRQKAADILEHLGKSESKGEIKAAFEDGDFRQVVRLSSRLPFRRRVQVFESLSKVQLRDHIKERADVAQLQLRAQLEEQLVLAFELPGDDDFGAKEEEPMVSFRLFQEAAADQRVGKELGRAVEEAPENPGPLNGYALSTQALEELKRLSPVYLKRFIGWLDGVAILSSLPNRGLGG